jgi:hypothetical protein
MGNIAASNAIWVKSFGIQRRKGNTKKTTSNLRFMALINYNESSNEEEEEEVDVEVGAFQYQYHPNITTSSSVANKSSNTSIGYSSKESSPSSAKKGTKKCQLQAADDKKPTKKERKLDLNSSDSDNSILDTTPSNTPKKKSEMDKMKEQLKQNQTHYDELHKMIQALTQQMLPKPEVKPNPELSSPKKDNSNNNNDLKDDDENGIDM